MEEEQATQPLPSVEKQAGVVEPTLPQTPDLPKEIERKEAEIKRLQGLVKDAQKRGVPKEELVGLRQEIAGMKKWTAKMMDDVVSHIRGEYDDSKPSRKTYSQQIEEEDRGRPEPRQLPDPDAEAFVGYMQSQGFTLNSPLVKEAIAEERSPQEALEYLKGKIEAKQTADVEKRAEQIATQKYEQMLKEKGLTGSGVSGPTTAGTAWRDASPEEKILRGVSGKK